MLKWIVFVAVVCVAPALANYDSDPYYERLVRDGEYEAAIRYTCRKFRLDCSHVRFRNLEDQGASARTSSFNQISVYPSAFLFKNSGVYKPGWLGALIAHELVHRRQSKVMRSMSHFQITFGNHYYEAALEWEAWNEMFVRSREFGLTCAMVSWIEDNLYYYGAIFRHDGRLPRDEDDYQLNYSLPSLRSVEMQKACQKEQGEGRWIVRPG